MKQIRYFGTDIPVQLNDAVKMRRWFRMVDGAVVYVPGVSKPDAFFGKHHVGIQTYDGHYYGIIVEETAELWKTVRYQARGSGAPPELPDNLDEA